MLNLIKLEIKKFKLSRYIWKVLMADLILCGMTMVVNFGSKFEGKPAFNNFKVALDFSDILVRITFIIFASVVLANIVIDEFRNKTINLMFLSPIDRKKILISKLIIVAVFTFASIIVGDILIALAMIIVDKYTDIIPGVFSLNLLGEIYIKIIINAIASSGIALIPLFFGMRKKSSSTTIVSAVILVFATCGTIGGDKAEVGGMASLTSMLPVSISIGLIGVLIAYLTIRNIESVDVN